MNKQTSVRSSFKELDYCLKKAANQGWALGQFNTSNLEVLRAILKSAERLRSPVIIGTSEGESKFIGLNQIVALAESLKTEFNVPFFLNLDHGQSFAIIKQAIEAGYSSVHFDGSKLPLKENIKITKEVVKYAEKRKVLVEGEVGSIGGELTEPDDVKEYIKQAKVNRLAVNIGTKHGIYVPKIDFARLNEIKKIVGKLPLVLHGGSGVPEKDIKQAISLGIAKININSELRAAFTETLRKSLKDKPNENIPYKYLPDSITEVEKVVENKIKLFNSQNKI
ncbi:MAG: class II fructose-bisphosphate aldolase [Candidatus Nealsonbacteria bacterium]